MLEFLRKSAGTWVVKILFLMLIVSFGVWGVGDILRSGGRSAWAIKVGEVEIAPSVVREQFDRRIEQLRKAFGDNMTAETARQMGMVDSVVRQLADGAVLDMTARQSGLAVSDEAVRAEITRNPAFNDQSGRFSVSQFRSLLAQNGLTEDRYVSLLREDLVRQRVIAPLVAPVALPKVLVSAAYSQRNELRRADILTVAAASLPLPAAPADADLNGLYQENIATYTLPEERSFRAVTFTADAVAATVKVTDEEAEKAWQDDKASYSRPETRSLRHLSADSEDTAKNISRLAAGGLSLADAVRKDGKGKVEPLGDAKYDDLPPDVADVIFQTGAGKVTAPVLTPFGWQVFEVVAIHPAEEKPFAEVREQVIASVKTQKAVSALYDSVARVEDALAGGATPEEVARDFSGTLVTVRDVTAEGTLRAGGVSPLPAGEVGERILSLAFSTDSGRDSRMTDAGNSFVLVHVDGVTPATPRPLAEVRNEVLALWQDKTRKEQAARLAGEAAAAVTAGKPLAEVAKGVAGASLQHTALLTREGADKASGKPSGLSAPLLSALFAAGKGEARVVSLPAGAAVVVPLESVLPVLPADQPVDAAAGKDLVASLHQDFEQGLMEEATHAWGQKYGVLVNQDVLKKLFE